MPSNPLPFAARHCTTGSLAKDLDEALSAPPTSLAYDRGDVMIPPDLDNAFGRTVMKLMGFYSPRNKLIHGGQFLYDAIKEQVDDGALHKAFGLDAKVFYSTYTLLSLHVWLVIHRLGVKNDKDSKWFKQRFYTTFSWDVEKRIYASGVQIGVARWAKKLETIFYSSGVDLDKVLDGSSKESVPDVVLRHFFGDDPTKRPQAAAIAAYLRRELKCLQLTPDEAIFKGHVRFSREPFLPYRVQKRA